MEVECTRAGRLNRWLGLAWLGLAHLALHDGVALHLLDEQAGGHVREADVAEHLLHQAGLLVVLGQAGGIIPAQPPPLVEPEDGGVEGHDLAVHQGVMREDLDEQGLGQAREVLPGAGPAARQVRHDEEQRVSPQGPAVVFL